MGHEIVAHTWQFDASVVAQMLSPKQLKKDVQPGTYHPIGDYDCLIDQEFVQNALAACKLPTPPTLVAAERPNYVQFLNHCVDNCESAYIVAYRKSTEKGLFGRLQKPGLHWWAGLTFFEYNKQTGDGVGGAEPVEPDFVGARRKPDKRDQCYWAPPGPEAGILWAGEVNYKWPELIRQATTYARAMNSAVPMRLFSVVIGVNHSEKTLRFLIFHRGGLTISEALDLKTEAGCRAVQKIMFSVYLWQKPRDAGFPAFINGHDCVLPDPRDLKIKLDFKVTTHLYHAPSVRGRGSFVVSLTLVTPNDTTKSPPPNGATKSPPYNLRAQKAYTTSMNAGKVCPLIGPMSLPQVKAASTDIRPICPTRYHEVELVITPPSTCIKKEVSTLDDLLRYPLVAKFSWPSRKKRALEPAVYNASVSDLGTPVHLMSFEVTLSDGSGWSNAYFLPTSSEARDAFFSLSGNTSEDTFEDPDHRSMWVTVFVGDGESLENCTSALDLCECLLQAALGELNVSAY
ncbi:hypothetical protein K435DRAFT_125213 [Dendrothele bispora CBS 962.96]|uniref:Uncharacterized protein n=1 Tax=Dendrothele bispora (strain CBS 962.96) TaxID=1314807 RepID=A0A4S8KMX9_DENBC|nr:hypothetical protein K435DRAFT_125213 [Dendrothele bispora CBS 962.96]